MIRNLKYVKNIIENYFKAHPMIQDIKFGDTDNLSTYKDLKYPLVNYEYVNSTFNTGLENLSKWEVVIADLADDESEFDVIDNANEIAQDFLKYLEKHDDVEILGNITIAPFQDNFGDRTAGVLFTVTFNAFRNNCLTF